MSTDAYVLIRICIVAQKKLRHLHSIILNSLITGASSSYAKCFFFFFNKISSLRVFSVVYDRQEKLLIFKHTRSLLVEQSPSMVAPQLS